MKFWKSQLKIDGSDMLGQTALHHACFHSSLKAADILLENQKTNAAKRDLWGRTALHLLCMNQHTIQLDEVVGLIKNFINAGVSAKAQDILTKTASDYVVGDGEDAKRIRNALNGIYDTATMKVNEDEINNTVFEDQDDYLTSVKTRNTNNE